MKKVILLLLLSFVAIPAQAESLEDIREVLKFQESQYNAAAIGDGGDSYGILQIQWNAILDVNRKFGTTYTHQDAFDVKCSEEIFELYITMWTAHLEKKQNRKATTEDIVRIWNGGPNGYKRKSTLIYLVRYRKNRYLCQVTAPVECKDELS